MDLEAIKKPHSLSQNSSPLFVHRHTLTLPPLLVIRFAIMVLPRSTAFLLIFILLPLRFSSAHTHRQDNNMIPVVATAGKLEKTISPVNGEQIYYHAVPAVVETDQRTKFLPVRKMMSNGVPVKSENEIINMAKGSATEWKARCVIGNCNHQEGKGILSVKKHKFGKRNGHYVKVKMSSLVPLNADYYVPRPHPPKNN
ncbi:hypothetical protein VNO77_24438 [Canavalia gladiata]|uniref:Uncharacterized protein n=1 Tax=Canavalia gladiata TaxID=3824 RepID=A0AAN9L6A6_CANGL